MVVPKVVAVEANLILVVVISDETVTAFPIWSLLGDIVPTPSMLEDWGGCEERSCTHVGLQRHA